MPAGLGASVWAPWHLRHDPRKSAPKAGRCKLRRARAERARLCPRANLKGAYSGCTTPPRLPVTVGVPESQVERSRRFRQPLPPAGPCRLPPVRVGVSGRATQQPSVPPRPSDRDDPSNLTGRRAQAQIDAMRGAAGLHRGRNGEQRLVVLSCTNLGYSSSEISSTVMLGVRQRANPSIP
jgi:hypothetical protein